MLGSWTGHARTGRTLWTSPGRQGDNAALVAAGNVVMATTTPGRTSRLIRSTGALMPRGPNQPENSSGSVHAANLAVHSDVDLVVVGAGPAGSTAAIAALRADPSARVLVLDDVDALVDTERAQEEQEDASDA